MNEYHSIKIEFTIEADKKRVNRLIDRLIKTINKTGITFLEINDNYTVENNEEMHENLNDEEDSNEIENN